MALLDVLRPPLVSPLREGFRLSGWTPQRLSSLTAWYDPRPGYVYQDGVTAAGVGDPVGLLLDRSKALALGPELVTNGGPFVNTDDWSVSSGSLSVDDDNLVITGDGSGSCTARFVAPDDLDAQWLRGRFEIVSTDRNVAVYLNGNAAGTFSAGMYTSIEMGDGGRTDVISFQAGLNAGETVAIGFASVRRLQGHHATQTTTASKPTLAQSGGRYYIDDDGVDDEMTVTLPSGMSATSTVAYSRPGTGAEINTVDLSGGSYMLDGDYHALVICDGQISSADQARLTQYLDRVAGV